jgi:membrane fusion protein (multidrug efflux system)
MKKSVSNYLPFFITASITITLLGCSEKKQVEMPVQQINVVEVLQKDVQLHREFVGEVFGEKDIPIRARVEGVLEGIHFQEGLNVKKGQLLYTIDPKPLESKVNAQKSRVAEAETMLAKAKSDLDRYKPLAQKNAVSKSDLDARQAQYDAAISSLEAAKSNLESAKIELGYTKIYSPIAGLIGRTNAKVGDFVGREPNPVILNTVSETNNVKVIFFLTEAEYLGLYREMFETGEGINTVSMDKVREPAKRKIYLILSDGRTYEHSGTVDFVDRGVDPSTGTMLVQANFPNPDLKLRPGLYAKVKSELNEEKGALLIPQRCVMEMQGIYSVYLVNDSNKVETRRIITSAKLDDYYLVKDGLKVGEKIVLDGLQKVRSGMVISPKLVEFQSQSAKL